MPASSASFQRGAHRHQRSPGFSPGKPYCGKGVLRSLPAALEKARNSLVITAHTVCRPRSSGPVSQQPLRKNPVTGSIEQGISSSPSTLRAPLSKRVVMGPH